MTKFYKKQLLGIMLFALAMTGRTQSDPLIRMAEQMKPNVVAIRATFADGEEENGFGFISGEKDGRLFIATAAHVARGQQNQAAQSIEVLFWEAKQWIKAECKEYWFDEELDLALLQAPKPANMALHMNCGDFAPEIFQKTRFVGVSASTGPKWSSPGEGEISELSEQGIYFAISTLVPGSSGAPLFNERGIIGIIINDDASASYALSLSTIQKVFETANTKGSFLLKPNMATGKEPEIDPAPGLVYEMVLVKGGSYVMGCQDYRRDDDCEDDEKPATTVSVPDFWMGTFEVTQAQWLAVMGRYPEELYNKHCDNCPMEGISYTDIQEFIVHLNASSGKKYRLPTEAEWEYAARGGQFGASKSYLYSGSNTASDIGWFFDNYADGNSLGEQKTTNPVGSKKPNQLGLYDMSGNVWEWVEDDWHDNYERRPSHAKAWADTPRNGYGVIRGGSFADDVNQLRAANRMYEDKNSRTERTGFRLAITAK